MSVWNIHIHSSSKVMCLNIAKHNTAYSIKQPKRMNWSGEHVREFSSLRSASADDCCDGKPRQWPSEEE